MPSSASRRIASLSWGPRSSFDQAASCARCGYGRTRNYIRARRFLTAFAGYGRNYARARRFLTAFGGYGRTRNYIRARRFLTAFGGYGRTRNGRRSVKRAPPKEGLSSTTRVPPCSTTIFMAIARPRPVPFAFWVT